MMNLDELEEYKEEKDFTEIYVGREDLDEMFLNEISRETFHRDY